MSGRLLGVDVVAAAEVDVGVQRRGEACEIDVVERPAGVAFTLDDLVHVVGVPGHDRAGDEPEGRRLRALAVECLQADAAFVAVYSLQATAKVREGRQHPDRDAQFEHINATVAGAVAAGEPVISVDTKKKELVGDFKNGGREWRPAGEAVEVRTHDFKDPELGKAIPYGVYDVANDEGWVSVGIDHDSAQFAVASIEGWWRQLGRKRFPNAQALTITADCGVARPTFRMTASCLDPREATVPKNGSAGRRSCGCCRDG